MITIADWVAWVFVILIAVISVVLWELGKWGFGKLKAAKPFVKWSLIGISFLILGILFIIFIEKSIWID